MMRITDKSKKVTLLLSAVFLLLPFSSIAKEYKSMIGKHGVVAYTWNSSPDAEHAVLTTSSYTFNYGRAVNRQRLSAGVYQVNFDGLSCNRGQFTVNAYGGKNFKSCRIGSWSGNKNCEVSVYCFNAKGEAIDSQFNLLFID